MERRDETEALREKIKNERITFKHALEQRDRAKAQEIAAIRHLADMVLARVVQSFGTKRGGEELVLDIPAPRNPEGKMWAVKVEQPDKDTYRLVAKLYELPVLGETKDKICDSIAEKLQEE